MRWKCLPLILRYSTQRCLSTLLWSCCYRSNVQRMFISYSMVCCILGIIKVRVFLVKKSLQKTVSQCHPGDLGKMVRYKQAQKCLLYYLSLNAFNRLLQNFIIFIQWNFLLTNCLLACLIPSGKCNLIAAKVTGLIFSQFEVTFS